VLLAGGSTMVLLVAAGSARLVDSAVHHDAVLRETATYLAPLLAALPARGSTTSSQTRAWGPCPQ
jgi:hypothetical protein